MLGPSITATTTPIAVAYAVATTRAGTNRPLAIAALVVSIVEMATVLAWYVDATWRILP